MTVPPRVKPVVITALLKGKLIATDNTLPFLMELQRVGLAKRICMIYSSRSAWRIFEEEKCLADIIESEGIHVVTPRPGEGVLGRLARLVRIAWAIRHVLVQRAWFLGGDQLPPIGRLLAGINRRVFGGASLCNNLRSVDPVTHNNVVRVMDTEYGRGGSPVATEHCHAVLATVPLSAFDVRGPTDLPVCLLGYARGFPAWRAAIAGRGRTAFEPEIADSYFFWPLTVLERQEKDGKVVRIGDSIEQILRFLARINYPLQVVFRYHPTTDRQEFSEIIKRSGFRNFAISFCHPHELIEYSRFVFSETGTSLFCDAWYAGKPVVQFVPNDDHFAEHDADGRAVASIYQPVVDHFIARDWDAFRDLLMSLKDQPGKIDRAPAERERRMPVYAGQELVDRLSILQT